VALIIVGVGAALYMLAAMGELLVEGRIRALFRRGARWSPSPTRAAPWLAVT